MTGQEAAAHLIAPPPPPRTLPFSPLAALYCPLCVPPRPASSTPPQRQHSQTIVVPQTPPICPSSDPPGTFPGHYAHCHNRTRAASLPGAGAAPHSPPAPDPSRQRSARQRRKEEAEKRGMSMHACIVACLAPPSCPAIHYSVLGNNAQQSPRTAVSPQSMHGDAPGAVHARHGERRGGQPPQQQQQRVTAADNSAAADNGRSRQKSPRAMDAAAAPNAATAHAAHKSNRSHKQGPAEAPVCAPRRPSL